MAFSENWSVLEPDIETVFAHETNPLQALADARIAGIALRGVYNPDQCSGLMQRFVERGMMRDPERPTPEENLPSRIDIGSSLVNRVRGGLAVSDDPAESKEAFLQHSASTHELFSHLFDGFDNPVDTLYDCLSALAVNKEVKVAREPDGRLYGPAIFRIHYEGHEYTPHINHVAIDDKLFNFEVSRFTHQFAALICIQNSLHDGDSPHAVIHRCTWSPEVQAHLSDRTYHEYAAQTKIEQQQIEVQPGDFYLFNSGCIHQVAAVEGNIPRTVLATLIGYSEDDDEIFVWA
jgi:hypothetical protein